MKIILISMLGALLMSGSLTEGKVQVVDDIEFATPVVSDAAPPCTAETCAVAAQSVIVPRRPVADGFQKHRPVRRVLRCAVRFARRRCCS